MRSDSEFQSAPELAHRFGGRAMVDSMIERDRGEVPSESIEDNFVSFATSPDDAAACPNVRGKTRTRNRITKGESSQHFSDRAIFASLFVDKYVHAIGFEVKTGATMRIQDKSFDANAEVTMEKIFEIDASAPGMIASEVLIKGSINGVALGGALDDIGQTGIRSVPLCRWRRKCPTGLRSIRYRRTIAGKAQAQPVSFLGPCKRCPRKRVHNRRRRTSRLR